MKNPKITRFDYHDAVVLRIDEFNRPGEERYRSQVWELFKKFGTQGPFWVTEEIPADPTSPEGELHPQLIGLAADEDGKMLKADDRYLFSGFYFRTISLQEDANGLPKLREVKQSQLTAWGNRMTDIFKKFCNESPEIEALLQEIRAGGFSKTHLTGGPTLNFATKDDSVVLVDDSPSEGESSAFDLSGYDPGDRKPS